jgi:Ca2+-binding RTX toxin-like protein
LCCGLIYQFGEAGSDLIVGGVGGDILKGGLDADLFQFGLGDQGDLIMNFNEGGVRDGFDLRPLFDAVGYAGTDPRADGIMQVLQNGADTDVFIYGVFFFRVQGVVAAAIDDSYFLFQ